MLATLLPIVLAVVPATEIPSNTEITSRLKRYMSDAVQFDHFSGAVLVVRKGKVLFSKGYGMANAELNIPNKSSTKFRIGSVSKQFTAAAIMQLQDRGKLKIGDLISKYIEDTPAAWEEITLKHLLNHTSGLVNYTTLAGASGDFLKVPHSHEEVLRLFRDRPLESKPGEAYNYNNSGYYLLGMVVEKCSGQPLGDYLRTNIFKPIGLTNTDAETNPAADANRAVGYSVQDGLFRRASFVDMRNLFAIGGLSSSVEDLLKWERALRAGKVISKASVSQVLTPGKGDYGFGWIIDRIGGHRRMYHDGGVAEFSSSLQRLIDADITVIAISNRGEDGGIRVAYDAVGWMCGVPATVRAIQPELFKQSAEASFKMVTDMRKKFPIFDIGERKVNELGNYLVISRRKPQAVELFKLNVLLYPKSSEAHFRLALNYSWAKKTELAIRHVEKALQLNPNHPEAGKLLSKLADKAP
jgi:CubicO group peptidase (beta-lactamase class C family)